MNERSSISELSMVSPQLSLPFLTGVIGRWKKRFENIPSKCDFSRAEIVYSIKANA